jgi:hypothetical protein
MAPSIKHRRCGCLRQSNYTAPEEETSQRQAHKHRDNVGKKKHERFVSTLVTLSRHAIVADITRAAPATKLSEQCARQSSSRPEGKRSTCGGPAASLGARTLHLVSV